MIEISHNQARRLIREQVDRRLPEDQWAMLQGHLERCDDCRLFREQMQTVEKDLRRSLRGWYDTAPQLQAGAEPAAGLPALVTQARKRRAERNRAAAKFVLGAAAVLLLVLFGGRLPELLTGSDQAVLTQEAEQGLVPPTGETAQPTAQPLAEPGEFGELIAFESDGEIYLLNPGLPPENFSNHPAADTHPAWSPDGEWIAFLSERAAQGDEKKNEVFVADLTGKRVVQLTAEQGVTWQGPLSWSANGEWIALTGVRADQGSQRWVYLVPLNGGPPRALAGTRNGFAPEFAPWGDRLAYATSQPGRTGVVVYSIEDGETDSTDWETPSVQDLDMLQPGSWIDWSIDGSGLAYVAGAVAAEPDAEEPGGSQVVAVREASDTRSLFEDYENTIRVSESRWPVAFRAVTWSPGGPLVYLEDMDDARANDYPGAVSGGCWTVQVRLPSRSGQGYRAYPGSDLCVASGLDRSSWTPDGNWLVVSARMPAEESLSLYAVRMPARRSDWRATPAPTGTPAPTYGTAVRLTDGSQPVTNAVVRTRLLSWQSALNIDPKPVDDSLTQVPPSDMRDAPGMLVYTVQNNTVSVVASARPDGTGGRVLFSSQGVNRCPRWSPDGERVAFLNAGGLGSGIGGGGLSLDLPPAGSYHPRGGSINEEVLVIDRRGSRLEQVSDLSAVPGASPGSEPNGQGAFNVRYSCPVWSPDGEYLALFVDDDQTTYLAILPSDPDSDLRARFLKTSAPVREPAWTPNSRRVVIAHQTLPERPAEILAVDLPEEADGPLSTTTLRTVSVTEPVRSLAISPDGWQVVMLASSILRDTRAYAILRRVSMQDAYEYNPVPLGDDYAGGYAGLRSPAVNGMLAWLPDDGLGVILRGKPDDRYKAMIQRYDLERGSLNTLALVEDRLYSAAWSADGNWLMYSSESGLWALDVEAAQHERAAPAWISPEPVFDLDWS